MPSDAGGGRTSTCWSLLPNIGNMLKLHPGEKKQVKAVHLQQDVQAIGTGIVKVLLKLN
jgi:hypothetical protein